MKKSINKPEVKVVKLQKMNVIATSGGNVYKARSFGAKGLDNGGSDNWYQNKF